MADVFTSHLDAVRAIGSTRMSFGLATGGDDCTVKIWAHGRCRPSASSACVPSYLFGHLLMGKTTLISARPVTEDLSPQYDTTRGTLPLSQGWSLLHRNNCYKKNSASLDSTVRVWALPHRRTQHTRPFDSSRLRGELIGHTDAVWDLALVRDEEHLDQLWCEVPSRFGT